MLPPIQVWEDELNVIFGYVRNELCMATI